MVSSNQIKKGIARYIDTELMPQLPQTGWQSVVIGTAIGLALNRTDDMIDEFRNNSLIKNLGIIKSSGEVDIDTLCTEMIKHVPAEGFAVEVPIIGVLTFHKEDIDKIRTYIKEEVG